MGTKIDRLYTAGALIRAATTQEAEAIGAVHYQAWLETYTGMLPDSFLATRSPEKSTAMFRANQCRDTVVAEVNGMIVGFCGWGAIRDDRQTGGMGEIYGIYLLKKYQRMGLGRRMMEYAVARLEAGRYGKIGLWVLEDNHNAIRFYEKQGFRDSGIRKAADLGEQVTELLYVKQIGRWK